MENKIKLAVDVALYGSIGIKICAAASGQFRSDVNLLACSDWTLTVNDYCIRLPLNRIMKDVKD